MPIIGRARYIMYVAWDNTNSVGKTGDSGNHTLRFVDLLTGAESTPGNAPAEVDATNTPGLYKLLLTEAEAQNEMTLHGKSSTSGVAIIPVISRAEKLGVLGAGTLLSTAGHSTTSIFLPTTARVGGPGCWICPDGLTPRQMAGTPDGGTGAVTVDPAFDSDPAGTWAYVLASAPAQANSLTADMIKQDAVDKIGTGVISDATPFPGADIPIIAAGTSPTTSGELKIK